MKKPTQAICDLLNGLFRPSETSFKKPAKGAVNSTEPLSNSLCVAKTIRNLAALSENAETSRWTLISSVLEAIPA